MFQIWRDMLCMQYLRIAFSSFPFSSLQSCRGRVTFNLSRFDFFKPVGWFHMGPVVDGKHLGCRGHDGWQSA